MVREQATIHPVIIMIMITIAVTCKVRTHIFFPSFFFGWLWISWVGFNEKAPLSKKKHLLQYSAAIRKN